MSAFTKAQEIEQQLKLAVVAPTIGQEALERQAQYIIDKLQEGGLSVQEAVVEVLSLTNGAQLKVATECANAGPDY